MVSVKDRLESESRYVDEHMTKMGNEHAVLRDKYEPHIITHTTSHQGGIDHSTGDKMGLDVFGVCVANVLCCVVCVKVRHVGAVEGGE